MSISASELRPPVAEDVKVTRDVLRVTLSDGRVISAPLTWFPRLLHASLEERGNWRLIGKGQGVRWEDLDEDVSVDGLLSGQPSGESQESLKKWLQAHTSRITGRSKRPG